MGKIIGIDLGTSNSVCSILSADGKPEVIINADGGRTTPSVVAFKDDGEIIVGSQAKNQAILNPLNTIYEVKRLMGHKFSEVQHETERVSYKVVADEKGYARIEIKGKRYSPEQISAKILSTLKKSAEDYLHEPVTEAVITVPAYFNDAQRQATKDAGKIAGLDVKRIINEPTAAALAYGVDKSKDKDLKVVVTDAGAGTTDISVLDISDGVVEVVSTNGDTHLGGSDVDEKIVKWINDKFREKHPSLDLTKDPMSLQRLKTEAEKAKIALSTTLSYDINLPFIASDSTGPINLSETLTRSNLESLISDLIEKFKIPLNKALEDAHLKPSDVDKILLVGGTCRIPLLQRTIKEYFGKEPERGLNPDECVSEGAAIQGGVLNGDVRDILLLDVTPLTLAIETMGDVATPMIPRNSTIPIEKTQVFSTAADGQTEVTVKVLQGERTRASQNRVLGEFNLTDIPSAPRGIPQIEVKFAVDANGILNVTATDKGTGKAQHIEVKSSSSLSDDEINKAINEAKAHEEEDKIFKEKVEAKNTAEAAINAAEKSVKEYGDKISSEDKKTIEDNIGALKHTLSDANATVDDLKNGTQKLQESTYKIAEAIYKTQPNPQNDTQNGNPGSATSNTTTSDDGFRDVTGTVS